MSLTLSQLLLHLQIGICLVRLKRVFWVHARRVFEKANAKKATVPHHTNNHGSMEAFLP